MGKLKEQAYYDITRPGSFGGVEGLKRRTGQSRKTIKNWLSYQDTYTLHKPIRKKFPRRRIIVGGIDHQWQADLIDVRSLKKHNKGISFLLTCVDVLSKYAWVVPLKKKTGEELVSAFKSILLNGRKPLKLQTDKGSEFRNRFFQNFLKRQVIDFFVTENEDIKAAIVERFNRTLKEKLWRYFTKTNTRRYWDVLQALVGAYNASYHRSIKRAPKEVTIENQESVWQTLYGQQQQQQQQRPKFRKGDRVRISKARKTFKKGYLPSWTEELFTVKDVLFTDPLTYTIKDDADEELKGSFYPQELQKVGEKDVYPIEKILKQRKNNRGEKEYLVRWVGYPSSFDSWIPKREVVKV